MIRSEHALNLLKKLLFLIGNFTKIQWSPTDQRREPRWNPGEVSDRKRYLELY
ncbi:hypothetical protein Mapa_002773 [Marchantia paleacea]|nr:hypothetical protein Mapa_002773 [Marchantia paleacea]